MERGSLYSVAFAAVATVVLLGIYQIALRLKRPADGTIKTVLEGNTARALHQAGHVLGLFIILGSVIERSLTGEDPKTDVMWVSVFSLAGSLVLAITGWAGSKLLLKAKLGSEIDRGNIAAGVASAGHYVSSAILLSASMNGRSFKELGLAAVFFALSQITLNLFVVLFRALTSYDDGEEVLGENVAAAISYAGITIGLSLIIARATDGDFEGWMLSIRGYGAGLIYCAALYVVRQFIVQTLILGCAPALRGGKLDEAIARQRNVGMAALEACAYVGTGILLSRF